MLKKFKYGFTLAEVLTTLFVVGVIMIFAFKATVNQDKLKEKQLNATSKSFYASVDNVYGQILSYNTTNGVITAIEDKNNDGVKDSKDLRDLFNKYMDGDDVECSKIGFNINGTTPAATNFKNAVCSMHPGDVVAGYYLDTNCTTTVTVKEAFIKDDTSTRTVTGACGYVVYGIKGSKGILGKDVFTIALGKIGVKP